MGDRQRIWMGQEEIEINAQRNRMEFLADGCDYRKVTEENRMMRWKGELIHPASYWFRYEEEQRQLLLEQAHEEELFVASSSSSTKTRMSLRKSPTISSLAGMA